MTHPLQPAEPFAQHPRLAELVNALHSPTLWRLTRGRRSFTRPASSCCATGSCATRHRLPSPAPRCSSVVPLEVTDALLEAFRRLADRHERGFMVEHVMELLAAT